VTFPVIRIWPVFSSLISVVPHTGPAILTAAISDFFKGAVFRSTLLPNALHILKFSSNKVTPSPLAITQVLEFLCFSFEVNFLKT
jgi:hypothetical protein